MILVTEVDDTMSREKPSIRFYADIVWPKTFTYLVMLFVALIKKKSSYLSFCFKFRSISTTQNNFDISHITVDIIPPPPPPTPKSISTTQNKLISYIECVNCDLFLGKFDHKKSNPDKRPNTNRGPLYILCPLSLDKSLKWKETTLDPLSKSPRYPYRYISISWSQHFIMTPKGILNKCSCYVDCVRLIHTFRH